MAATVDMLALMLSKQLGMTISVQRQPAPTQDSPNRKFYSLFVRNAEGHSMHFFRDATVSNQTMTRVLAAFGDILSMDPRWAVPGVNLTEPVDADTTQ